MDYTNSGDLTDMDTAPDPFPDLEFDVSPGGPGAPAMEMTRGTSPTLSLVFKNPNFRGDPDGNLRINNVTFTDQYSNVTNLTVNGNSEYNVGVNIPANSTFTVSGISFSALPSHVTIGWVEFDYLITSPTGVGGGAIGVSTKTYLVYATPTGWQALPWCEVLDYSCTWADGLSASPNVENAQSVGLWTDGYYDPNYVWFTDGDETFYLKTFLEHARDVQLEGQCNDFSDFLACAINSQGIGADSTRSYPYSDVYWGGADSGWELVTNSFIKAGTATSTSATFTYHQFVLSGGNVQDGAIKLQTGGSSFFNVCNWSLSDYKTRLVYQFNHYTSGSLDSHSDPWNPTTVDLDVTADDM